MKFYELAIGASFVCGGQRFVKTAMSMAQDEQSVGNLFLGETEVMADGEPNLLPPTEAARWKPNDKHWSDHLGPAPSEKAKVEYGTTWKSSLPTPREKLKSNCSYRIPSILA